MASTLSAIQIHDSLQASVASSLTTVSGSVLVADQNLLSLTAGSAAGSADGVYTATGSIVSGTPVVINLLSLTDPYGVALTVAHIAAIKITNTSAAGAGSITHGGGTNPVYAAQSLAITAGDYFSHSFNAAGLPVVVSSTQNLQMTASTGTVTYKVTIFTRSA